VDSLVFYLPPIVISLVDEQQNFIFFHENSFPLFRDVLEVKADTDKGLIIPHAVNVLAVAATATANTVEHGASITRLKNEVTN
jgi:hypothetical protein